MLFTQAMQFRKFPRELSKGKANYSIMKIYIKSLQLMMTTLVQTLEGLLCIPPPNPLPKIRQQKFAAAKCTQSI